MFSTSLEKLLKNHEMGYKRPIVGPLSCPQCGKEFFIEKRELARKKRENKDKKNVFCSRSCASSAKKDWRSPFRRIVSRSRKCAKNKQIKFNLDLKYLTDLWFKQKGNCSLSGVGMIIPEEREKTYPNTGSLDRIDSDKGYIKGNVQWICLSLNYGKYKWPEEDFKNFLTLISLNIARNEVVQHKR